MIWTAAASLSSRRLRSAPASLNTSVSEELRQRGQPSVSVRRLLQQVGQMRQVGHLPCTTGRRQHPPAHPGDIADSNTAATPCPHHRPSPAGFRNTVGEFVAAVGDRACRALAEEAGQRRRSHQPAGGSAPSPRSGTASRPPLRIRTRRRHRSTPRRCRGDRARLGRGGVPAVLHDHCDIARRSTSAVESRSLGELCATSAARSFPMCALRSSIWIVLVVLLTEPSAPDHPQPERIVVGGAGQGCACGAATTPPTTMSRVPNSAPRRTAPHRIDDHLVTAPVDRQRAALAGRGRRQPDMSAMSPPRKA